VCVCVWNFDETVCVAKGDVRRDYIKCGDKGLVAVHEQDVQAVRREEKTPRT